MTNASAFTSQPASQAGALASHGSTCGLCGMAVRSSLPTIARRDAAAHAEWHAKTGR